MSLYKTNNTKGTIYIVSSNLFNNGYDIVMPQTSQESPANIDIQGDAITFAEVIKVAKRLADEYILDIRVF